MDTTKWTEMQKKAIDTRGKNILVSAAAGSGKTAVLTQRIINLVIEEKLDITSMLVLTFTNAAANEMKSRIQKKMYDYLSENKNDKHIKKQISLISSASISTMHAFCINVLRENFDILGIDPSFVIGNESTISILKDEAIQEVLDERFENDDLELFVLEDIYSSRYDDTNLINIVYSIYRYIQSKKEPFEWLYNQVEKYNSFDDIKNNEYFLQIKQEILEVLDELIQKCELAVNYSKDIAYYGTLSQDLEILQNLKIHLVNNGYDYFVDEIRNIKLSKLATKKKDDDITKVEVVKNIRDTIIKKGIDNLKEYKIKSEQYIQDMKQCYPILKYLCKLVEDFDNRYNEKKLEKNIFDFNDLEQLTLKLLKNDRVRENIKSKYKYIFYDEYQDSNEVHNSIIQSISQKDNLFFVGDVKQSIYGFRLADPSIFMQKYESYKKDDNSIKIDLSSNFRSTKQILDFCNKIFEIIINEQTSSMKYDEDAKLISNDKYCYNQEHIQINLLDRDSEIEDDIALDLQKDDIMAQVTAKQILEIMNKDKSIKFSDIAVLKRSFSNSISSYQKAFRKYNIPVFIDYSSAIFEVLEVSIFIDLLNIIDNIRQDIPLISVMMSNIGGFTIQEITQIKSYDIKTKYFHQILLKYANDEEKKDDGLSKKVSKFINKIANYTRLERYMRLDEFVEFVMIDSKYKDYVLSMKSGDMRFQNLSIVTEKAREFMQNENKSLFNFLTYINSILKNKSDKEEPQKISENQNVVRIMSIHKSKGLEFPIVILNDIDKKFNTIDTKKQIVLESNFGIGVDYVNLQEDYYTKTLAKRCIINKIQKNNLAEEIRILYVALTRAKKVLFLNTFTTSTTRKNIGLIEKGIFTQNIMSINNYRDFILYALQNDIKNNNYNELYCINNIDVRYYLKDDIEYENMEKSFYEKVKSIDISDDYVDYFNRKYSFDYKYKDDIKKEIKLSVTDISKEKNRYKIEKMIKYSDYINKSNFTSDKIGILNHLFLQYIDFTKSYDIDILKEQLENMVELEFITKEEAQVINLEDMLRFLNSDIGCRLKKAKKIYKEESFITNYNGSILSGVVDLFFLEEDGIVLIDYKTDHILKESINDRALYYKNQIELYKEAIQSSFDMIVKESYIYFLSVGEKVKID